MFHLQNELTIFIVYLNNLIITRDFKNKNELKINPSKYLFIYLYKFNSFQPLYVCKRIYYFSATASKSASSTTTFLPPNNNTFTISFQASFGLYLFLAYLLLYYIRELFLIPLSLEVFRIDFRSIKYSRV